jgi:dihydroxy-acid dehydratase
MGKPLVAIVNSWNEVVPGHIHLRALGELTKQGVREAGGIPLEFDTIAMCDGMAQGHAGMGFSLPSREAIADTVEIMIEGHRFDAMASDGGPSDQHPDGHADRGSYGRRALQRAQ